jgi:hypothetical protein
MAKRNEKTVAEQEVAKIEAEPEVVEKPGPRLGSGT